MQDLVQDECQQQFQTPASTGCEVVSQKFHVSKGKGGLLKSLSIALHFFHALDTIAMEAK
jgi:hypothetical protein